MKGNRKHGFMRGSRAGRNGWSLSQAHFCDGCQRTHGKNVFMTGLNGKKYCERTYYKAREAVTA